ncbi:endonuclease/exonuclease/phosphatase family protein [Cognatishimia sp. MH4019]|uniref:endonuclease/exonuclease/phosphatase family protein n=1 Tax=Cognatishimia sp. MH4019 TaxID=2854030 RepID=UPI001CD79781|nr:endonuclease/exonuclease/phosphatase family protein [Cognatishimia sp. MH4019]
MKRLFRGLLLIALMVPLFACAAHLSFSGRGVVPEKSDNALRVATLNVHYIVLSRADGAWSVADWERRKGPMAAAVSAIGADVLALQESESFGGGSMATQNLTLDHLLAQNPALQAAAVGDPVRFPITQPILYRADRLAVEDQGWFFFSETPDQIYSRTFNGSWPAFASWAQFRDLQSGAIFRVVNVHFEYRSRSNRRLSAALVRDRIAPWINAGEEVFVLGDLNALRGSATLGLIEEAGVQFVPVRGATYHFNRGINLFGAIDHLGHTGGITLQGDPVVLRQQFEGEWPTDHYPVFGDFTLR